MCVFCLEPLWHVPASSSRGPGGGGGQRRIPRQDVPGKDSPNRHSKVSLHTVSFFYLLLYLLHCLSVRLSHSCAHVHCRVRISTRATPAVTLCPVTPLATTVTSAGSTEELEETEEEVGVASLTQLTPTPTFLTREGPTTAASTPRLLTTTLATETCPTTSHTRPCTPLQPTVAFRSCPWEGAAAEENRGDESLHPSYQLQPIRTKGIGRGHSHLLVAVLIKWMLSNPGKRPHH